jgi:hypothetical protein
MARINRGDLVTVGFYIPTGGPTDYWLATERDGAYWRITNAVWGTDTMIVHRDHLKKVSG